MRLFFPFIIRGGNWELAFAAQVFKVGIIQVLFRMTCTLRGTYAKPLLSYLILAK